MHTSANLQGTTGEPLAVELASMFTRLGFEAVVRDPDSVAVLAATPGAEAALLASEPGSVRVVTARISGVQLRVEVLPVPYGPEALTSRQQQIAELLKRGMRNGQIATQLGISVHTVRRHVEQVFRRLGVNNRRAAADALRRAAGVR